LELLRKCAEVKGRLTRDLVAEKAGFGGPRTYQQANETQRASVAAKLANIPQHANQHTVSGQANLPDHLVSQTQAADMLNVSERSLRTAKKVQEEAIPEITERMSSGEMSLNSAAMAASLPEEERTWNFRTNVLKLICHPCRNLAVTLPEGSANI
jgi:hypothetical protein